jgi:hypothetical protein
MSKVWGGVGQKVYIEKRGGEEIEEYHPALHKRGRETRIPVRPPGLRSRSTSSTSTSGDTKCGHRRLVAAGDGGRHGRSATAASAANLGPSWAPTRDRHVSRGGVRWHSASARRSALSAVTPRVTPLWPPPLATPRRVALWAEADTLWHWPSPEAERRMCKFHI